jgi:hypothetical protein
MFHKVCSVALRPFCRLLLPLFQQRLLRTSQHLYALPSTTAPTKFAVVCTLSANTQSCARCQQIHSRLHVVSKHTAECTLSAKTSAHCQHDPPHFCLHVCWHNRNTIMPIIGTLPARSSAHCQHDHQHSLPRHRLQRTAVTGSCTRSSPAGEHSNPDTHTHHTLRTLKPTPITPIRTLIPTPITPIRTLIPTHHTYTNPDSHTHHNNTPLPPSPSHSPPPFLPSPSPPTYSMRGDQRAALHTARVASSTWCSWLVLERETPSSYDNILPMLLFLLVCSACGG